MNTGELLERVRLEIFNDLTDAQIVGRFNEHSKRLFRKFVLPDEVAKFLTTDIPYYNLPENCSEDRIRCVTIDDVEFLKVTPEFENPPANFCTVILGSLFISPKPATGKEVFMYYRPRPVMLSAAKLEVVSNLPEDYHELFVYDAAGWIAGLQRDIDMKNNFQAEYDSILKDAIRELKKMGLRRAKETMIW